MRVSAQCVFPAIQVRLRRLDRLEAQALQRRLLRVADAGFDFPFAIGIAHAARQRDDAVVGEDVAIERIERRIVDVRREHAFAQVVEVMCPRLICGGALGGPRTGASFRLITAT